MAKVGFLNGILYADSANLSGQITAKHTVQTTDATVTDLATIALAEGKTCFVTVMVVGEQSDASARGMYKLDAVFYRATGGNVTLQGNVISHEEESVAAWDADLVADTVGQTIDLDVTGEAATTINWTAFVQYFIV